MMQWRLLVGAAVPAVLVGMPLEAQVIPFEERTFNEQVLRPTGQPVIPIYEGWYENPDGTHDICFGYFNLNTEEVLDVPLGPDNYIEPAEFDGMQPTHFDHVPVAPYRRHLCVFTVTVPADFGDRTVVWTLNTAEGPLSAPGKLLAPYVLDEPESGGRGIVAPVLRLSPEGPGFRGRSGFTGRRRTVAIGRPLDLSVWVDHPDPQVWVAWTHHQGSGPVEIERSEQIVSGAGGVTTTRVWFSEPGEYLMRVQSIHSIASFEFHCCWTNGYVPVTVMR